MANYSVKDQLEILKKNFNDYSLVLINFLAIVVPKSPFRLYKLYIEQLANERSNKIIDMFILSVLKYEDKILEGDEEFFLCKNYDGELNNDKNRILKAFEFKSIWKSVNDQNRSAIKSYMVLLCKIARKYFNLVYDGKPIK
jgi:hypothetical protein